MILDRLGDVLDCPRQFQPSRRKEQPEQIEQSSEVTKSDFNGSETQLDYFVYLLILQHRGSDARLPGSDVQYFHPTTRLPFNTLLTFRIREAANRIQNNKPMSRSVQKHKRYEAGTMNIQNLEFELHEGLLEEEPAYNIQAEHIKIPDMDNAEPIDVVDEHGNKLIWNADGIPKLIFAGPTPAPLQSSEQIQAQDQPKAQQRGYGFAYSESDTEDDEVPEQPVLSIAGGSLNTGADKTQRLIGTAVENCDDSLELQQKRSIASSPRCKQAPLSLVDPNRKIKALRGRKSKEDMVSGSASMQVLSVVAEDHADEDASSSGSETGSKRKQEEEHDSNGRTGGFGFAEEQPALDSSSPLPSLSGPASPALPSSPPPHESTG